MSQQLDAKLQKLSKKDLDLWKLRHTAEHILHQAVKELYPSILLAMGPATEDGFYFDFDHSPNGKKAVKITEDDFPRIEKRMQELIDANLPMIRKQITPAEAKKLFSDNPYKLEWIQEIEDRGEDVTVYWTGAPDDDQSMVDLCSGPHAENTGKVQAFTLLSVAGAYWHGDESNKMLTRIYGTAFESQKELDEYLERLEEAKKRDHRKLGAQLGLFTFSELVGRGLPLLTEKGATIWRQLERFVVDEELKRGYKHVKTPNIAKTDLYKTSGHYPYYKDTMYPPMVIDNDELILRPMTCPHHFALYSSKPRSYRELPLRYAELATLYRYEKSGELTGLLRVREFTLADSHNFVRTSQASDEIHAVLDLIEFVTQALGLEKGKHYTYRLSLGDLSNTEKYYDDPDSWKQAEEILREVLTERNAPFYEAEDEAAFYGPKIDVQMKNVLGKEDTAFTVQYDFCLPSKFNLSYTNEQGENEQPIVIHRSSIGALERTLGFLIEHYAGEFPLWLAPIQVVMIPIADRHVESATAVAKTLLNAGIRVEVDDKSEPMGAKIRTHTLQKVPYLGIIGDREAKAGSVTIRAHSQENQTFDTVEDFLISLKQEIEAKKR